MANPNIFNATSIIGETITAALTTTMTTALLTCPANKIIKINTIIISNIDGLNVASFTLNIDNGVASRSFAYQITVPAGASVVIIDRNSGFYLKELETIRGGASMNLDLVATISYEIIS